MSDAIGNNFASKAAALLSRGVEEPDGHDLPGVYTVSVRLPVPTAAKLAAMAHFAGCSRNAMANMIFDAGIKAIFLETPSDVVGEIAEHIQENISDFL